MGFNAKPKTRSQNLVKSIYAKVEPEDLIKFGLIPEFVGRVPVVAHLDPLSEDDLCQILTKPKNALIRQYERMFEMEGVTLKFQKEAILQVARQAIERKLGARGLRLIMEDLMLDFLFEIPTLKNTKEVTITAEMVRQKHINFKVVEDMAG